MAEDRELAVVFRRLLADPGATATIHGHQLTVHGTVMLTANELGALAELLPDPAVARRAMQLRAQIVSLQRTADHLRGDRSRRWDTDADKLERVVADLQAELEDLTGAATDDSRRQGIPPS